MEQFLEMIKNSDITGLGLRLVGAAAILVVGLKLSKWLVKVITSGKGFHHIDAGVQTFLRSSMSIVFKALVLLTAIGTLGIPMTSFVTLLGTAGVAVGLALQGGLSNIAGGVIVLLFKPFNVGDYIVFGSHSGTVADISIFYTKLDTLDNRQIVIPNGTIANGQIENVSAKKTRRVDLTFTASYTSDISKVQTVLLSCAEKCELVFKDPAPFAALSAQQDSALEFVLRAWCNTSDYWTVYFDLNKSVKEAFDKNGIEIPFPQMDVHIDKQA